MNTKLDTFCFAKRDLQGQLAILIILNMKTQKPLTVHVEMNITTPNMKMQKPCMVHVSMNVETQKPFTVFGVANTKTRRPVACFGLRNIETHSLYEFWKQQNQQSVLSRVSRKQ